MWLLNGEQRIYEKNVSIPWMAIKCGPDWATKSLIEESINNSVSASTVVKCMGSLRELQLMTYTIYNIVASHIMRSILNYLLCIGMAECTLRIYSLLLTYKWSILLPHLSGAALGVCTCRNECSVPCLQWCDLVTWAVRSYVWSSMFCLITIRNLR